MSNSLSSSDGLSTISTHLNSLTLNNSDSLTIEIKDDSYAFQVAANPISNEFNLKIISSLRRAIIFSSDAGTFIHCFPLPGQYHIKIVKDQKKLKLKIKQSIEPGQVWYELPIPDFSKN